MTSDYNRLESHREDYGGNYSRAGMDDGGDLTAAFLEEIRAELPDPVAAVHSDETGTRFYSYCSTCSEWGTKRVDWAKAWTDKESHNQRFHDA